MKRPSTAVWLVIACCFVSFAGPRLGAQDQCTQAATGTVPSQPLSLSNIEKRLQGAEGELASIRKQMNTPLTVEARRVLLERMEHLDGEVQQIRRNLDAIKEQQLGTSTREASRSSAAQTCLADRKIIESQEFKDLAITLTNDQGQLTKGQNTFCIEFRRLRDGSMTDPGEVRTEATLQVGRVKAMRAVVRLSRSAMGRYCAHADFPSAGSWSITVRYKRPSGKEKAVFPAVVN